MRVSTRITLVTSVLVTLALAIWAALEVGRGRAERRRLLEREAREVAHAVRSAVEAEADSLSPERARRLSRELSERNSALQVRVIWREAVRELPPSFEKDALERLQTLEDIKVAELRTVGEQSIVYTVPVRRLDDRVDGGYQLLGTVEAETSLSELESAWRDDLGRILPVFAVVLGLMIAAILVFIRRLVTGPIDKLVSGMDEVAHGDLTRVLLAEREDEIGALAARFNTMTASLRESREETQRQNEARSRLEEQLSQTEKLATIGQLAAEIAHEVGTPLNVIAGRARSLGKKAGDPEAIRKNSGIIAEQASRITRIIQRLLDFARRKVGTVDRELVDLNEVTASTMDFLDSKFRGAKVASSLERESRLPQVLGHPDQLQQVLINLLLNAVDAVGEGGEVRVTTYCITRRRPGLEREREQPYAVISVSDSGPGIPAADREKIFEPFYTSKDGEGGTGLGLAVSFGIIKEHDGWIEVGESQGGGSQFRVFLPIDDPSTTESKPAAETAAS